MSAVAPREAAYGQALLELGAAVPELLVLDAGLGSSMQTGAFAAAYPARYVNLGIGEQNAVGVASGLARRGFVPLLHSFANFLARRAHDQIAVSVAWPRANVKLIGGSAGLYDARNGPSHLAIDDLGAMAALPGLTVIEPADQRQLRALLAHAVELEGPVYLRLRRLGLPADLAPGTDPLAGTVEIERPAGALATVIAGGSILPSAVGAARVLADHDRPVELFGVAVLRPLAAEALIASAARTGCAVIVENHLTSGAFGSIVGEALEPLGVRIRRIGLPDEFLPAGEPAWQLRRSELDPDNLAFRIAEFIDGG